MRGTLAPFWIMNGWMHPRVSRVAFLASKTISEVILPQVRKFSDSPLIEQGRGPQHLTVFAGNAFWVF
jgi:hypothetical protein